MTTEPWAAVEDVAKHLGVAKDSVYLWIESRKTSCAQDRPPWKFKLTEVDEWGRASGAEGYEGDTDERAGDDGQMVLVHLSDIHFTGSSGTSVYDLDSEIRNEILRDAATVTKELGGATGVLVTGDIASPASVRSTSGPRRGCSSSVAPSGVPRRACVVRARNHDVDRKIANSKVTKTLHESIRAKQGPHLTRNSVRSSPTKTRRRRSSRRSPSTTPSRRASNARCQRQAVLGARPRAACGPSSDCEASAAPSCRTSTTRRTT